MKLYYSPGACPLSPHIVLCEAGLSAELIKVDLQAGQTENGDDFKAINPNGYVPVLVLDNGETLSEGPAIVQYLADQVPDKQLVPVAGSFERYRLQQWLNFISTELHKGFSALFNPAIPEEYRQMAKTTLASRLDHVANHLSKNTFVMGDSFTVADAYLFVILSWGPYVEFDLSAWPSLGEFSARIASRPAVQQALKEEGLLS